MTWTDLQETIVISYEAMSGLEVVAVVFAILYVLLASYEKVLCWPAALISVTLYIYLCYSVNLYLETILQFFYFIMAIYGWYEWLYGSKEKGELPISSYPLPRIMIFIAAGGILTLISGFLFDNYTDSSLPYLDATTTIFAFIATWMVARKIIENWLFWIVIDFLSIYLYASRELYLTSLLFLFYTIIALFGYFKWKKSMQAQVA